MGSAVVGWVGGWVGIEQNGRQEALVGKGEGMRMVMRGEVWCFWVLMMGLRRRVCVGEG